MAFPPGFLDELRSRISLSGLIGSAGQAGPPRTRICRIVSVPSREDAVFLRRRGQILLSLLRLRRPWRCDRVRDAGRNLDFIEAVEKLAGRRGWLSRRRPRKSGSGRSGRKPYSKRPRPPQLFTRSGCGRPVGCAHANICKDAGSIRRHSDISVWAGPPMIAKLCGAPSTPNFPIRCWSRPGCGANRPKGNPRTISATA